MRLEDLFPYEKFRAGQRELAQSVYLACKTKNRLLVEAMSGFGKTAPVLAGSLLAATDDDVRIIYACRTKRQVLRVLEEIQRMQQRIPFGASALFAKIDYCLLKETARFDVTSESFKWYCSFNTTNNLCSYFLNLSLLDKQLARLMQGITTRVPSHSQLMEKGKEIHLCPYEIARLAIATSRIVVTTYHYLLDESARSVLLGTADWSPSRVIGVIDEAHNVRDFIRDQFTTEFSFTDIRRALGDARALGFEPAISFLKDLENVMREYCSSDGSWHGDKSRLIQVLRRGHDDTWLSNVALELSTCSGIGWQSISTGQNLPTSIMKVGTFLRDLLASEQGVTLAKSDAGVYLVNTRTDRLPELTDGFQSLVLLSATINPSDLFLRSIGLSDRTSIHKVNVHQGFCVRTVIDIGVSSRFKLRSPETFSRIALKIAAIGRGVRGSIGVFFPSYALLESLRPFLTDSVKDHRLISETRNLTNSGADLLMNNFKNSPGSMLLAVQGGRFSEGEDFPGDQMDVSIVVGFSLPPPSPVMFAELAGSQFDKHDTYLVVSLLPAVRKAVQAAGRHIRSPDKKGMVFLMDARFNQKEVLDMIPEWLKKDMQMGDFEPSEIELMVRAFFGNQ